MPLNRTKKPRRPPTALELARHAWRKAQKARREQQFLNEGGRTSHDASKHHRVLTNANQAAALHAKALAMTRPIVEARKLAAAEPGGQLDLEDLLAASMEAKAA